MKRKILSMLLTAALLTASLPATAAVFYKDVPSGHWSVSDVEKAASYGLMQGLGDGVFGLGKPLDRASFVTILSRMFAWESTVPAAPSYSDCGSEQWYYEAVETARSLGVADATQAFRPGDAITRAEMAVMLVRALGYETLADTAAGMPCPFADVTVDAGYINVAYEIGMTNGVVLDDGMLAFLPDATAKREEAAAMLVRVYERYHAGIDWLHGFYAFSSYGQIAYTGQMDAVSLGWARISVDPETGPWINSTAAEGNAWVKPEGAATATDYFRGNGTPYQLNVFTSVWDSVNLPDGTQSNAAAEVLATPEARTRAVTELVAAAEDYTGLTIDFEGLNQDLKEPFTAFMTQLRQALAAEKPLYVCVMPDNWYDGYDYRALGEICDKVILMAHDYQWPSIPAYYVGTTQTDCPVTPFPEIYRALCAVTDPETGVQDRSRLALAISFTSAGFEVDSEDKLLSQTFYNPVPATIITRLRQADTRYYYSEIFRNPYLYYTTETGSRYRLWYEDERSVTDKIKLAEMFGVTGVSLWRLGIIPNYDDQGLHYNVWNSILAWR